MTRDEGEKTVRLGDGYLLVPPWYAYRRLTRVDQQPYFYGSSKLLEIGRQFLGCASKAKHLSLALSPPPPELAEHVSQPDEMDKHQYLYSGR